MSNEEKLLAEIESAKKSLSEMKRQAEQEAKEKEKREREEWLKAKEEAIQTDRKELEEAKEKVKKEEERLKAVMRKIKEQTEPYIKKRDSLESSAKERINAARAISALDQIYVTINSECEYVTVVLESWRDVNLGLNRQRATVSYADVFERHESVKYSIPPIDEADDYDDYDD